MDAYNSTELATRKRPAPCSQIQVKLVRKVSGRKIEASSVNCFMMMVLRFAIIER